MADEQETRRPSVLVRLGLYCVVPILLLGGAGYLYAKSGRYITTENAYVKADIVQISTNIDGLITNVFVNENQHVNEGDPVFAIDPRPFEKTVAIASADMASARQTIEAMRARYQLGEAAIKSAKERVRYLKSEFNRQQELLADGVGTQAKFDETEHNLKMAKRELTSVREDNRIVLAELSGDADIAVEQHPAYLHAEAKYDIAALNLSYARVNAPTSGILTHVSVEPGEYVEAGEILLAIVGTEDLWVEANLKEVDLEHLKVGQSATVILDSLPDVEWQATVDSISPATGAEFSVLPAQNATGNWVKVVQRIPVRLVLADRPGADALRAGLTAAISIDTERERSMATLIGSVFAQSSSD
ncbi:MAG: HlyD family secretion protein [Rhodospirillales bacterium]|jgi:membrane fusion protein, multidrug efflux system|nr:HlyD family secretion protein [Rhodospirillales bacterium]MBT4040850.1 HlyD family secretion protein [Rhodospirillales bacterium]MBT4625403.1 HlyD family secretion protein [Rhodospirillales bacterium]MBT5351939.1 HlyD family secretion protein [Rhodospirillales bacterium]MBT5521148.1 HlyD family secretion protein [Rhodospirillales bacterium]